jgi:hypothetical protein
MAATDAKTGTRNAMPTMAKPTSGLGFHDRVPP